VCASERGQLEAFIHFLKADAKLLKPCKRKVGDFAAIYNGKDYKKLTMTTDEKCL